MLYTVNYYEAGDPLPPARTGVVADNDIVDAGRKLFAQIKQWSERLHLAFNLARSLPWPMQDHSSWRDSMAGDLVIFGRMQGEKHQ